jgi:hypothetical protein
VAQGIGPEFKTQYCKKKKKKKMCFLYKNEHRIFKPVEITIKRGLKKKGEK